MLSPSAHNGLRNVRARWGVEGVRYETPRLHARDAAWLFDWHFSGSSMVHQCIGGVGGGAPLAANAHARALWGKSAALLHCCEHRVAVRREGSDPLGCWVWHSLHTITAGTRGFGCAAGHSASRRWQLVPSQSGPSFASIDCTQGHGHPTMTRVLPHLPAMGMARTSAPTHMPHW
jgi:hypothetical protein